MSTDKTVSMGAAGRSDLFTYDPETLILVTDKLHALYDPRMFMVLDEQLVLSVMKEGVNVPILVRKNGVDKEGKPVMEVVDGRQRVRAAIEANKRLVEAGSMPIRVPAVVKIRDDKKAFGLMVLTNEMRKADEVITKAEKALKAISELNYTEEEVAGWFGVSVDTVRRWLELMQCEQCVLDEVRGGNIPVAAALEIGSLPRWEQQDALTKLLVARGLIDEPEQTETHAATSQSDTEVNADTMIQLGDGKPPSNDSQDEPKKPVRSAQKAAEEITGGRRKKGKKTRKVSRSLKEIEKMLETFSRCEVASEEAQSVRDAACSVLRWAIGGGEREVSKLVEGLGGKLPNNEKKKARKSNEKNATLN